MSDEAVEFELETSTTEQDQEKQSRIPEGWDYTQYRQYFPADPEQNAYLEHLLSTKDYGWKLRAKGLIALKSEDERHEHRMTELRERLVELSTNRLGHGGVRTSKPSMNAEDHFKAFLESLDEAGLRTFAEKVSVNYDSFMRSGGRGEVIEAIIDEAGVSPVMA